MPAGRNNAILLLAKRFLLSKGSDQFLSLISWVSVVGVALGVLALVVVTSVINGFEGELIRVITGMNGDVILYTKADPIRDSAGVEDRVRKMVPEMTGLTHSFVAEVMVSGPAGVAGAILEGLDFLTVGKVTRVATSVPEGRLPATTNEVALGRSLAEKIGAKVGDSVRLISPFGGDGEGGNSGAAKAMEVKVVGISQVGMYEYDSKYVFASLGAVQGFLGHPDAVTTFKIALTKGTDSRRVSDRLTDSFGYPFRAKDWGQLNKNLLYAIHLEKAVIGILLTVIIIIAAFNVVSTLVMMIHDKTKEIAILKAMGFPPSQSFRLFVLIGTGIGLVGTVVGVVGGLGLSALLARTRWIELPANIYYIDFLPVVVRWTEVAVIAGLALIIALVATLYPAIQVARRSPLEGIRYE